MGVTILEVCSIVEGVEVRLFGCHLDSEKAPRTWMEYWDVVGRQSISCRTFSAYFNMKRDVPIEIFCSVGQLQATTQRNSGSNLIRSGQLFIDTDLKINNL